MVEQLKEVQAKLDELVVTIRESVPMRATGAGHVHNEVLTLSRKVGRMVTEAEAAE